MPPDPITIARAAWAGVGLLWLAMAFATKRTVRRAPGGAMLVHMVMLGLCFNLMFSPYFRVGFLRARFVPEEAWITWAGCAATLAGIGFIVWARFLLGRNWSGIVTLKEDHTLERRGPYRLVRHPIYSGLSFALLGTAVIYGEVRCLLAAILVFFEWKRKSLMEERLLIEQFGREYIQYRREVKGLIPFVW